MIFNLYMIRVGLKESKDHTTSKRESWDLMSNHLIFNPASLLVLIWDGVGIRNTKGVFKNAIAGAYTCSGIYSKGLDNYPLL